MPDNQLMTDADVTVVILNYNTEQYTLRCLRSILEQSNQHHRSFRVVVVDNGSRSFNSEALVEVSREVEVILAGTNLGFGRACNLGAAGSRSRYLYFLNNDTLFLNDVLRLLGECLDSRPDVGICGAQQFDEDLHPIRSTRKPPTILGRPSLRTDPEGLSNGAIDGVINAHGLSGANLFIRADLFQDVGGFDPRIFLYHEEDDLAVRVRRLGVKLALVTEARIQHFHAKSSPSKSWVLMEDALSLFYYYEKHAGRAIANLVRIRVALGYAARWFKNAVRRLSGRNTRSLETLYSRLARWAFSGFSEDVVVMSRQTRSEYDQTGHRPRGE